MRTIALSAVCASLMAGAAFGQPMQLDPEGFGTVPVTDQQSLVSLGSDLGPGFVPAKRYTRGPVRTMADATGFLDVNHGRDVRSGCTAVLIAPTILMTNAHCVPQSGPDRAKSIVFQTGFEDPNRTRHVEYLRVDPMAIEYHPAPLDMALLRLIDGSERVQPITFDIADPEPDESLFIVGHPKARAKHVSMSPCFAANEPMDGVTVLHDCNTHKGNSGSFIVSQERRDTVVGLHKRGASEGARFNMGTAMTRIASISPEFSRILGQDYVPVKPAPPRPVAGDPVSMVEACDRYAAHPYNPDNPPGINGVDWNDLVVTDAIAICDAALAMLPKHNRARYNLARAYHKDGQYEEARRLFERGIERDYAASFHNLASLYEGGLSVETDLKEAARLYERAAKLGHAVAARALGDMYRDAQGKTQDYKQAMTFYRQAFDLGDPEGAAKIGWLYANGFGVPKDNDEALAWYKIAAQADVDWAVNNLGSQYRNRGQYALAKQTFERALGLGYESYPNRNLAQLYQNGWGVPQDYDKAEEHYRAADAAGHPDAKRLLGDMFRDRKDGKSDPQMALALYEEAAEDGDKEAFAKIGHLYARKYVELGSDDETYKAAVNALEVAAAADIAWGKRELGRLYRLGRGVPEDKAKAVALFREAMEEDRNAKVRLADMYLRGEALPVDGKRALRLLEEAEAEDYDWARGKLIALLSRMPDASSVLYLDSYDNGKRTRAEQLAKQLEEVNFLLAWAQVIGLVEAPIPETVEQAMRLKMIDGFRDEKWTEQDGLDFRARLQGMHKRARALLAVHLDDLEARPEDGWLWGNLPYLRSPGALEVLFAGELVPPKLSAEERRTRGRLLLLEARESAEFDPDGPQTVVDGRAQPLPIREIQQALNAVGFAAGSADGKMGPATRRALSGFQRAVGLEPTGQTDAVTLYALINARWLGITF
ncbi:trypsin-like peptidase domain-containing protein [Pacificoceanicola onchidii]|uniref:trypsin-like peptidase domain-containing protein n=1 Tax=Pacificoceanicola onchidii TaxID=2562685 RepID=UPI0010A6AF37|nr:trypsin-like peptidase domain-containing protein [Pacificoceanicola onchidii]